MGAGDEDEEEDDWDDWDDDDDDDLVGGGNKGVSGGQAAVEKLVN